MVHIHHGIDTNAHRVRGLLDFFGFPRIGFRRHLHDLESNISRQFEAFHVTELLWQHVEDKTLLDGQRGRWFEERTAC